MEAVLHQVDDVLGAGERSMSVVEVLLLQGADTTASLDSSSVERCMNELKYLLETFTVGIPRLCDKGWVPQKWILLASKRSPDLTARIDIILKKLLLAYHIAARPAHRHTPHKSHIPARSGHKGAR